MSVQILLGGHSTLSLEDGLSGNRDEEKKRSGHVYMQLEVMSIKWSARDLT